MPDTLARMVSEALSVLKAERARYEAEIRRIDAQIAHFEKAPRPISATPVKRTESTAVMKAASAKKAAGRKIGSDFWAQRRAKAKALKK